MNRAEALVLRALSLIARGNLAGAIASWRAALEENAAPPALVAHVAPLIALLEGRALRAGSAAPAAEASAPRSEGWAHTWAADVEAAYRFAGEHPADPSALGVLGVAHLLAGRPGDAIGVLEEALAHGGEGALAHHRIRALVQLGRLEEAHRALASLGDGETLGRRILQALVSTRRWTGQPSNFRRACTGGSMDETFYNGLFTTALPAIVGQSALDEACASREALTKLLEDLLVRMAGNLGPYPTVAETTLAGGKRFVPLALPETTREASRAALQALPYVGITRSLAAFEDILAQYPRSVHARCYRGELLLWLGRYEEAWADFASTDSIEPTRWADIGRIAVFTFTGRFDEATRLAASTEQRFPPVAFGTLPVYRGLLRRRTGALDAAIEDLERSVEAKPSRIGARMELCLALRAAGRDSAEHAARILREAAPLLVDVADTRGLAWRKEPTLLLDDAVLEEALTAMRGNRSSSVVTWIDRTGELRILESPANLRAHAQHIATFWRAASLTARRS